MEITWNIKHFDQLSPYELYAILQLRSAVFVVEQTCVFQDMDDKDQACHHLMGFANGRLIAVTRLVPPGISYPQPSIGRVATASFARGLGLGRSLMQQSLRAIEELYGTQPIRIGAQLYLKQFYESLGFIQTSDIYDEDGIDHIEMTRP